MRKISVGLFDAGLAKGVDVDKKIRPQKHENHVVTFVGIVLEKASPLFYGLRRRRNLHFQGRNTLQNRSFLVALGMS